jgi:hypothetical protein
MINKYTYKNKNWVSGYDEGYNEGYEKAQSESVDSYSTGHCDGRANYNTKLDKLLSFLDIHTHQISTTEVLEKLRSLQREQM